MVKAVRFISEVIAVLLLVVTTIAALGVALTLITNYVKTTQPKGEVVDVSLVVRKYIPSGSITGAIEATLYITCTGPSCSQYTVSVIGLTGYTRGSTNRYPLSSDTSIVYLKPGLTKIVIVGYFNPSQRIDEVVVDLIICGPSACEIISKSATVG